MIDKNAISKLINENKKDVERLENRRSENLGNSINYMENEIQIQRHLAKIEALETVLNLFN